MPWCQRYNPYDISAMCVLLSQPYRYTILLLSWSKCLRKQMSSPHELSPHLLKTLLSIISWYFHLPSQQSQLEFSRDILTLSTGSTLDFDEWWIWSWCCEQSIVWVIGQQTLWYDVHFGELFCCMKQIHNFGRYMWRYTVIN